MKKKKRGFKGERIIDLLDLNIGINESNLLFNKIGFFPNANYHFEEGINTQTHLLIYCIKGNGELVLNKQKHTISIGDFFIIPKDNHFIYKSDDKNPWTIFWFNFKGELAEYFLKNTDKRIGNLSYNEERITLFNKIYKNLNRGYGKENLEILNIAMIHFLSSLIFAVKNKYTKTSKNQEIVNEAIEIMKKNVEKNITLEKLSQELHLSISHFSSIFKELVGVSPIEYYNQIKIQKACQYLENTTMLIKEISYKVNIQDSAYFTRIFTKIKGISPNNYRKQFVKSKI